MGRASDARERLIVATIDLIWLESYGAVTVDAICDRAGVKKGSFYHFFRSKDDLVVEALKAHWQSRIPVLDALFSATLQPLDRFHQYFVHVYRRQTELKKKMGRTPGCFVASVGVECAQQNPEIQATAQEILASYMRYYETTLRDAAAEGALRVDDIKGKSRALFAYMEGLLGQARIQNDPELLRDLADSSLAFLGIPSPKVASARK